MAKLTNYINVYSSHIVYGNSYLYLSKFNIFLPLKIYYYNKLLAVTKCASYSNLSYFSKFFLLSKTWFTKKLKFKHKLSWFFFKRRFLKFFLYRVGKSHLLFQSLPVYIIRKKRYTAPNSLILFSLNWSFLTSYSFYVKDVLPVNSYTLRGLRFSRQYIYKRQGKISKYGGMKSKIF